MSKTLTNKLIEQLTPKTNRINYKSVSELKIEHENLGTVNKNKITLSKNTSAGRIVLQLFFSYETLVGIVVLGRVYVRQNDWGPTTGKFLNFLEPNAKKRISGTEFNKLADKIIPAFFYSKNFNSFINLINQ